MSIIYSIGAKFAGGGIGRVAHYAVQGLYQNNLLQRLLCGAFLPTEIPEAKIRALGLPSRVLRKLAIYDRHKWIEYVHNCLFDVWASRYLIPANLFHVWGNYGLKSLQRARSMGMTTVVERASCHPLYQAQILETEYKRVGQSFHIPSAVLTRAVNEMHTADYILVPSSFARQTFVEQGLPENKLIELPFGVDTDHFRPSSHQSARDFRVIYVGRVGIDKGVQYLLEAWQQLNWSQAELWIVGQMSTNSIAALSVYKNLANVRWVGYVKDLVELYQQSDLFVFPSVQEGSALVNYEALACGLPVITTPNAGSIVRDGIEGFLTPIRDIDVLAARMEQLRSDSSLRQKMGQAARARAEKFTWKRYGDALASIYRKLR